MSRKAKIGITRDAFDKNGKFMIPGPGLKSLDEMPNVEYEVFPELFPEATSEQIRGFDMIVSWGIKWTQQTFTGNKQLLSILRAGVGYDMVDVPALTEAGVMLCITPNAVRRPMATVIITFILGLSLQLLTKERLTREGRWAEVTKYHGYGLIGKTLGSIGLGNIGHEMFLLARPFGMKHVACDPYVTQEAVADVNVKLVDMDTVLAESDFLNISCPLSENTRGLIGEKELRKMKRTAFLINTARGPIVEEAALTKALRQGWIRGAGLDVFEQEPTSLDNPLLQMGNTIVTPHALGWTDEMFTTMWNEILSHISQIIRGEVPDGLINREVWHKSRFQSKMKKFQEAAT